MGGGRQNVKGRRDPPCGKVDFVAQYEASVEAGNAGEVVAAESDNIVPSNSGSEDESDEV